MTTQIKKLTPNTEDWNKIIELAKKCSWRAGPNLAQKMTANNFEDYECVFGAFVENKAAGFCTVNKTDYIPNCTYSPWIGFVFVDENYRGNRISEKMCKTSVEYAKGLDFNKIYICTEEQGLYEKYGFKKCDSLLSYENTMEDILCFSISSEENIEDYGWTNFYSIPEVAKNEIPARIIAMYKGRYQAVCSYGTISAVLKGSFLYEKRGKGGTHTNPDKLEMPVTGDFVYLKYNNTGDSLITRLCKRKTMFLRNDFSGHAANYVKTMKMQTLACNFDTICILSSLNQDFNQKRISRYISTALQSKAQTIVLLTKKDKADEIKIQESIEKVKSISDKVPIFAISSVSGEGLEQIEPYLEKGKTLDFLGSSGVGKSTLVNAITGQNLMTTSGIREDDSKGHHTTTHRELIMINSGAMIMDTPGIRELGMIDAQEGIDETYSDIKELTLQCKFSNCTHTNEPGCAIQEAISNGSLDVKRFEEYKKLSNETSWAEKKKSIDKNHRRNNLINMERKRFTE